MFSVPGWSITAPLKTQTGPVVAPSPSAIGDSNTATREGSSKKRKRKDGDETAKQEPKKPKSEQHAKVTKPSHGDSKAETINTKHDVHSKPTKNGSKKDRSRTSDGDGKNIANVEQKDHLAILKKVDKTKTKEPKEPKTTEPVSMSELKEVEPVPASSDKTSKKRKRKKDRISADMKDDLHATEGAPDTEQKAEEKPVAPSHTTLSTTATTKTQQVSTKLTPLQSQMAAKLASARFRHLNETLYTTPSAKALADFTKNPSTFEEYHSGFRQQVDVWPSNPVDGYLADVKSRAVVRPGQKGPKPLPRTKGLCTIADLGCGDAKLAQEVTKINAKGDMNVKILSYDLYSPSPLVERADIANLPLEDGSVNVAIFCLALMGTNWPDFIDEAYRVLHWKGELWVAEIKSRFGRVEKEGKSKVVEHSVGNRKKKPRSKMSDAEKKREDAIKEDENSALAVEVDGLPSSTSRDKSGDETDVSAFLKVLASRGFVLDGDENEAIERGNKMFVKMRFVKAAQPTKGKNVAKGKEGSTWKPKGKKFMDGKEEDIDESKVLKPCVYKLR